MGDLNVPALKGRAKLISTLRVEVAAGKFVVPESPASSRLLGILVVDTSVTD
jgi:hypothetical protein